MTDGIRINVGEEFMPPESDIEIKIDFKEEGSAARVFDIASNLIKAFEDLDRVLITTVDSKISTALILEDVEKSSLKIYLRNLLKASDDQALKELDWKPQVGKYLVKAKYIALEWLDRSIAENEPAQIEDLTDRIRKLAAETDVRHLPDYPPINPSRLAQPLDALQRTKAQFRDGEQLTITLEQHDYHVRLDKQWLPSEHLPPTPAEQELSNDMDMVMIIRKPDFLAKTQWQFRHGKSNLSAAMDDPDWLREFHHGKHPIKPGDALRVRVRFEYKYNANGDLIDQKATVIKVYNVIPASSPPDDLFDED
ncbi:hypothetical protein J2766_001192 [Agrobacterium tumefaciens]|uniref:Uncharacterized protein n=2 Tax=Pseudomonadota TaxID=1224 RepID=A0AAW8LSG1_AGRTU|nr:hypothetical protein [Agrobacterium tumefaciens]MBP2564633.1 hypothetical protein [Agrobacterium tumefaciens]MDR6701502.1 hypothetical protein [Agrobacterium tumefaciens]